MPPRPMLESEQIYASLDGLHERIAKLQESVNELAQGVNRLLAEVVCQHCKGKGEGLRLHANPQRDPRAELCYEVVVCEKCNGRGRVLPTIVPKENEEG